MAFFQAWAKDSNTSRVNIVAILVDDNIYNLISSWVERYASNYVQQQLSDTRALVMPLNLSKISAYDIHRMMENIYFDWLEDVNSSLIGLIMIWDIPLPVVNQDGYIFPTVYPYVDFENQKYVWDADSEYFVSNDNPGGQAEIWHWLINYWNNAQAYEDFFEKIKKYVENPDEFIWDAIWYEDFIASKEWFLNENFPYYRNKIMFGEDLWYQRYSVLMKKMFFGESTDNAVDIVEGFWWAVESIWWNSEEIFDSIDSQTIETLKNQSSEGMHTTKMIQQEIKDSFLADYDDLFSNASLSTMRENVLAWWRWLRTYKNASGQETLLANVDSSSSMIQLKDTMYLWNENLQWLLENLNELMEKMIDKKIEDEKYSMDIVIPIEYKRVEWKRIYFSCYPFVDRFENYYFGKNARLINNAEELSIYRGTYRNLLNLNDVTYDSLLSGDNPVISSLDETDVKLKSIWWSYDIFSNQAEWNRWYDMYKASDDVNIYEDNKSRKEEKPRWEHVKWLLKVTRRVWPEWCTWTKFFWLIKEERKCETLTWFALRWWWWASTINLNTGKVIEWRYELDWYDARSSWKTIYDMWWFQSLLSGDDEWMNWKWWVDWLWKWPQTAATSFKSYIKYASPTEVEWWDRNSILFVNFYKIYANHSPNTHTGFTNINYWNLSTTDILLNARWKFSREWEKMFNIEYEGQAKDPRCTLTEKYSYKTLSSVVKHDSTDAWEINWIDYDKYWDEWELWKNYYDIRVVYEDVNADLNRIVGELALLESGVESNNRKISDYILQLSWLTADLKKNNEEWDRLDSEIARLSDEISNLQTDLDSVELKISNIEKKIDEYEDADESYIDEDWNTVIVSYDTEISSLKSELIKLRDQASSLRSSIDDKILEKGDDEVKRSDIDNRNLPALNKDVWKILSTVSEIIDTENTDLSDIYSEIVWLFADNIVWTLEYIIYLAWWNPEDYKESVVPVDAPRVPFLPEWIQNIDNLSNTVKNNVYSLRIQYRDVYDLIVSQQSLWSKLKTELRKESVHRLKESWVSAKIDSVDVQMNNIFTINSRDDNQDHLKCYTEDEKERSCSDAELEELKQNNVKLLQKNTADEKVKEFVENLEFADSVFKNITKVDTGWAAIIQAALTDPDFQLWTIKKKIDLSTMSGAAIINQYAWWAQTDWENSTWARVNHDLLAWATIHMSWMNVLTADRPIDSPRYVSMQSIAWNEIKLIYPDLFKVEVFVLTWHDKNWYDIHELLTWWQIKENLIKYLSWKVVEYNKILESEYKKAEISMGNKSIYYRKLSSLWFQLATPEKSVRPYAYFTYEDFENALWWSWVLDAISEMLYYQSLTNKKKLSTWVVADDIELIKKSFSLNDKREWVLNDYLTEWNEKIKNPLLVIPTYELSGYEVAYVNSDGKDYIIPTEVDIDTASNSTNTIVDISKIRRHQPTQQEEDLDDKCDIPSNWKLPIFAVEWWTPTSPWYEWLKCRWKHTLEEPFKIKLTFDKSLWEIFMATWLADYIKNTDVWQSFTAWGDQMSKFADDWESLLTPWTWYDADKDITRMQVEAERHNAELNAWWSDASTIAKNVKISNSNTLLSDSSPSSLLRIEPISDVGNITVEFMWTWDWSISVDGVALGKWGTITKTISKKRPFSGLITADCVAWKNALDIKIYWWGWYYEEVLKYTVSPGVLDKFEIKVYDDKTVAGMTTPVEVIWYDKCGNRVDWGLEKYDITASQWDFLKDWAYKKEITTNDFRKLRFYYRAPVELQWDKALIQISKHWDWGWKSVDLEPKNPFEQPLVDWAPLVKLNWRPILRWKTNLLANETYPLKDDESIYNESWKLIKWKLQQLDIEIEDLKWWGVVDVDNQVLVTSQNWLVYIWQVQKDENWNEIFFETSKSYISEGKATIYYYPSTVAWEDVISIDIPWLETRKINLSVKPAPLHSSQLVLGKNVLYLWDMMNVELFLSDKWWNLIDSDGDYMLFYDDDKIQFINPDWWHDWEIMVSYHNWYGVYQIYWTWAWLAYLRAWDNFYYFNVDKHIFPESGLNIMYLNYFGNDWWNQWGYLSDNKHYVENLMSKSNKIITTTTQLVSEDKIKKMIWKMEPWLKIWNPDKISTILTVNWGGLDMVIGDVSSMSTNVWSIKWMQVTQDAIEWILNNNTINSDNYAFFFPSDAKYSIDKNWVLFSSGNRIANIANWDVWLQLSSSFTSDGDNIWKLIYKWVNYGNIVIHCPRVTPGVWNFETPWERYLVNSTFTNWSTNKLSSVWIFDLLSNFQLNSTYKSIQNSDELDAKIGFVWDFKNITLFGEWEIVWEATRKFWSEFVINLGDPVLSRKGLNENVYGTNYDGGIWQEIYTDPENNIFWTYEIDFDGNWSKDLLVVYLDWSIRLSKNYVSMPDLRNMQELMRIAIPIKEVFVWDADGNNWEDIIILTKNNQLRAYLNEGGEFEVDGRVACLNLNVLGWEISSTPSNLEWIYQIFVEDMNDDKKVDIITYDNKWYIKVFYWWRTKSWPNYLSNETYACDAWWYSREANNITVVDALWISIDWSDVFDNSMLHWKWMVKPEIEISEDDLAEYGINIDEDSLSDMIKPRDKDSDTSLGDAVHEIMDKDKFDVQKASQKFINESAKYVDVTLYENTLLWEWNWNNYVFAPSSYLNPTCAEDKWSVRKNYLSKGWVLQDWDIVTVRVTIKAWDESDFQWAFGDIIQWPWNLYYDENKILKSIRFIKNKWNAVIKQRDWKFAYIVDNISLWAWDTMVFEYDLEYRSIPLRKMDITYETFYSEDELPDIKLQSVDGCVKDFDAYINLWWRSFGKEVIELQKKIDETYEKEDEKTVDYAQNAIDAWSNINKIPGIVWDKIDRVSLLDGDTMEVSDDEEGKQNLTNKIKSAILQRIEERWLEWLNMNLNVNLSIFEEQTDAIENVIDDITKWMCNGFQFGGTSNCPWLPVPFNQAFLAPWKYHLFGCWNLPLWKLEKWLPLFFFPSSMPVYPTVPIPDWIKTAADKFIRFLGDTWNYPSFVRIYVAPTLTAQVWIGICLWPYAVWEALKSPWSDLWGNCIVFAIKPQCNNSTPTNLESPYESFSDFVEEVRDSGVCLQSQKWPQNTENWKNSSPTRLVSYNSSRGKAVQRSNDVELSSKEVNDVLDDIQNLVWEDTNVREIWDNALKNNPITKIYLSFLDSVYWDDIVSQTDLYKKYLWNAKLTVADDSPVDYSVNADFWIINLEREAYIASEDWEVKNSIIIWDVDILWWEYDVNQIKWWIQQWLREIFIDRWLDPQIRYILNQLTKMHVNVILPDLSELMGGELSTLSDVAWKDYDFTIPGAPEKRYKGNVWSLNVRGSDYASFVSNEQKAFNDIKSGLWWAFSKYGSEAKTYKLTKGEAWSGKTSTWDWISNESVSEFNSKIWNPFEALASLMNESNIINVSTEPLTVKVPMIFSEDINAYQFYLQQWLEENEAIMQEWESVLGAVRTNCSKKPVEEQAACRANADKNLSAFIEFKRWNWPNMVNKIYTNLMILQEYRDFPFEIYEWLHVIDRYMSEIASLINNTVWYLSYWVTANAERFVWYIDAITLMLDIIKTYQLIIDFSVDWSKKCGNCARDTYDQYSCKLSFLCNSIQLPIIQIPNFKLPNITIDLSSVDIWLDIILPEFNFQPIKISLPDIPNLPEPPSIWIDINLFDLPDIPILPEPPTLPELPSFIPEVEIELPILPPAPELPELPNEIEGVIKFAGWIWKIYCIIKKWFWLVWESSLKAKIEQITQRTYEVKWIDNIMNFTNVSVAPLKNYGVDYEISSYVDLQFTMDDFYDYLDVLTKWINNLSETVVRKPENLINQQADQFAESLDWLNWMNLDIQLWMSSSQDSDLPWLTSDDIKYVDYDKAKKRLNDVLAYFKNEVNNTTFVGSIGWDIIEIENQVNKPSIVVWNAEWIENMKNEIMDYLDSEKMYYDDLATLINEDYDGFLAMVGSNDGSINNWNQEKLLTFNVQLFNLDSSTKETVKSISKTNPYSTLLENKQEIIDWYWNAINSNTSSSLWLTEWEYLVLRNNIWSMKRQISTLYSVMTPKLSTQLVAKNWELASDKSLVAAWEWARIWSNMEVAKVVDPSVFSNWIYEKMTEWEEVGKLTKVVNSDSFVDEIGSNFYDTERFWPHDIILWDENAIYRKCEWQICSSVIPTSKYYMAYVDSVPYEETRLSFDKETKLKIADWDVEVKNWKVTWQSYDLLSFSWDLSDADAYLIKLVERIDYSYEKVDYNGNKRVSYVLALPNWVELSDLLANKVRLELIKDRKKKDINTIENLYWKDLVQVVYYDSTKDKADIMISDVERKWYYWRISTLDLQWDIYYINSPWSNQVVAWKQILWDAKGWWSDEPPTVEEELFRPSVNKVVSKWDELEGYVWTKYILNMYWKDNIALAYIDVSQDGNVLTGKYTSEKEDLLSIPIDMHFYNEQETFDLYWVDQFWNETKKTVVVTFSIPTIRITDVSKNLDWETVDITAELSQDIDEWNVSFQRKRGNAWKTMKRKNVNYSDFFIWANDKVVTWTGYSFWNEIAMYDKDESVIALLNPDTSEIKLQSGYEDKFDINVKVVNSAVLYVSDKQTKENKFSVSIPTDSCVKIEAEWYNVENLPENWNMWMFNGWQVVHKDGNNILIASPTCHLYSEYGLEWIYTYDSERDAVLLELFEPSDVNRTSPIKVWLKTKSFLPK